MTTRGALMSLAVVVGSAAVADAHATGRAFILLLPTELYIIGGAVAVAASFALMALIPSTAFARVERLRARVAVFDPSGRPGWVLAVCPSLVCLLLVVALVVAGYWGSRDPLANPLPLFVWTVWWIGFTYLHALFGNLWVRVNPWSGLYRLATALPGLRELREQPPLRYPRRAGYWPAVLVFLAFAWFELIHPAPSDPAVLADAVALYLALTFVALVLFGESAWLRYGEAFAVFFRLISWLSPLAVRPRAIEVTLPALHLLSVRALTPSGAAFVLLALSSVSFDGFSRTFAWVGLIGENPLEYPGRTTLMGPNTAGLLGVFAALSLAYGAVVLLANRLSGVQAGGGTMFGAFVLAIVPIAFGYHCAHYLPAFLVDVQYAVRSLSDPLGRGWDLFGTRAFPVSTGFMSDPSWVYALWNTQVFIIVAAHIAAIYIAHVFALRLTERAGTAVISQLPMTVLMIAYTGFGLWLLSTPSVG